MSDDKKDQENDSSKKSVVVSIDSADAKDAVDAKNTEDAKETATNEPIENDSGFADKDPNSIELNSESQSDTDSNSTPNPQQAAPEFVNPADLFSGKTAPRLEPPKKRKSRRPLPIMASLLSIAALIGVGWSAFNQYQMTKDWQLMQTELKQQMQQQVELNQVANQAAQTSLQASNQTQQALNQQSLLVEQLRQALTVNQQRVRELSGRQKQDWLLAEAEYFIKLAQLKITLEKDKMTAIALLKTADERVLATGDNSLLELRQNIAADITELQLINSPDLSGITSQLNAISSQVPMLSLIALEFEPIEGRNKQDLLKEDAEFSWGSLYDNFLNDFVTIKDHSEPVSPLMTVGQRANLNSNIQLALQQAQIAVVRGDQGLYDINLSNAINWMGEFFKHDQTSQTLLDNLTLLSQMIINVQLPNELKAKQSIQVINQQRLYQWLEKNNPQSGDEKKEAEETEAALTAGEQL